MIQARPQCSEGWLNSKGSMGSLRSMGVPMTTEARKGLGRVWHGLMVLSQTAVCQPRESRLGYARQA